MDRGWPETERACHKKDTGVWKLHYFVVLCSLEMLSYNVFHVRVPCGLLLVCRAAEPDGVGLFLLRDASRVL